ncbi:MAG: polysaccharide deacetylase family protein, partial [Candidatus Eiseniibacteriota bacterium]
MESAPSARARAFGSVSRFLDRSGLLRLTSPIWNRARLLTDDAGKPAFPFLRLAKTLNAQILIYHRVNDEGDPYFGGVPTAVFERQMEYLASRFHVMALSRLVAALEERSIPPNAIAITFDDGYRDNYTNALPILTRYKVPATIFVSTGAIGSTRQLWHDDVFSAFRDTTQPFLAPYGGRATASPLGTIPERLRTQREFLTHVRTLREPERSRAIAWLREALRVGPPREAPGLMLSWDEVKEMHRAGIEFGSHTVSHPILS